MEISKIKYGVPRIGKWQKIEQCYFYILDITKTLSLNCF